MKALLISLLSFCFLQTSFCQITGSLVATNGQPIQLANVLLLTATDSVIVKRVVTDTTGYFKMTDAASASYILRITNIGYQTYSSAVFQITPARKSKDFGTLVMHEQNGQLAGVMVRAEKPAYQQKAEGMVVNVENSVLTKGITVLEVMERSPGVVVDHRNNNIALNGKSGVTVMMDGKLVRMGTEQLLALLNSMSADDIASIELLNTPSAKYDAEGSAGIVNIVLKKTKKKGTNGSVALTGGYGRAEKASGNLNLYHNTGKMDMFGSYSFNHDRSYSTLYALGQEVVPVLGSGVTTFDYLGTNKPAATSHNVRAGLDYTLNSKTSVGGSVNYNYNMAASNAVNYGKYTTLPDSILIFNGNIRGASYATNIITSIYAERKIREGEKINVGIDYLHYQVNSPATVNGSFVDKGGNEATTTKDSLFSPTQRAYANATIQVGVVKLDYTKQLSKRVKLETGFKATYTANNSISGIESLVNGIWASPAETINNIQMKEGIAAAYASVTTQISPTTNLVTGARYEYYDTHANNATTRATTLNRRLGQLFPSIFFTKKLTDNSDIQLSYTKRITRPTYNDLASYISYNDPLSVFTGNPLLKPTITNNIKLGYNYRGYSISMLLSRDDYPIAQGQIVASPSGNIVYILPQNVTYQNNISLQANAPIKLTSWWDSNYSLTGVWRRFRLDYTMQPAVKSYFGYSLNFSEVFTLPGSFTAELSGWYNAASYYGSSKVEGVGAVNAGVKKVFAGNKGSLQLSVTDLFKTTNYVSYLGAVTEEAFATKSYIKWSAESARVPIIKLTYSRSFGNNSTKTQRKNEGTLEESGRIK